jgi:hypothetical protein
MLVQARSVISCKGQTAFWKELRYAPEQGGLRGVKVGVLLFQPRSAPRCPIYRVLTCHGPSSKPPLRYPPFHQPFFFFNLKSPQQPPRERIMV